MQHVKACSPIVVTLFGIFMLVRELHEEKSHFPIVVTLFGIFMLVRDLQPKKAQSPIVVTLFGIFMLVRDLQPVYLQPIITQYFIDNKSEIWLLFLIAHSKR